MKFRSAPSVLGGAMAHVILNTDITQNHIRLRCFELCAMAVDEIRYSQTACGCSPQCHCVDIWSCACEANKSFEAEVIMEADQEEAEKRKKARLRRGH